MQSVTLSAQTLRDQDVAVIGAPHHELDLSLFLQHADLVIDTDNAAGGTLSH